MIGYLKGTIIEKRLPEVWVEVAGVGYRVKVGFRVYENLPLKSEAALFIHTTLRQDALELYGFQAMDDLKMFELLLNVSGVGPKTALTIAGGQPPERIEKAVREADVAFFQAIPGIGRKGAQRIIVDLKGKLPSLKELDLSDEGGPDDVTEALRQFGFKRDEIQVALKGVDTGLPDEVRVREGLKRLGRI